MLNFFDWSCLISCLIYIFVPEDTRERYLPQLFLLIVMILLFVRMYSLLSVVTAFTSKIFIINRIILKGIPFSIIIFFFYVATSMLLVFLDTDKPVNTTKMHFISVYYWVIFGGFDNEAFEIRFSYIAVIFGTIMVGVFLLNILIAYLSNEFSRLEEQQLISGWKEKASMNLSLELIAFFFKNGFTKVNNVPDSRSRKFQMIRRVYNNKGHELSKEKVGQEFFIKIVVIQN